MAIRNSLSQFIKKQTATDSSDLTKVYGDLDRVFREVVSLRHKFDGDIGGLRETLLLSRAPAPTSHCFSSKQISVDEAIQNAEHLERGYRDEAAIKEFAAKVHGHTMVPYDGLATLANQVRHCEETGIAGDYVELGTWKGGCLGVMAMANLAWGTGRRLIHGFDSFAGIPMPRADKDDMAWATTDMKLTAADCDGSLTPAQQLIGPRADVERLLSKIGYPQDHVLLHEGWFQDTVPKVKIDKIAILRIDGDLYDSYVVALDHLYDRVVPGGFVIFDDWILEGCRRAVTEFFDRRGLKPFLSHVDQSIRFFQKP